MARTQELIAGGFKKPTKRIIRSRTMNILRGTGYSGKEVFETDSDRIEKYIREDIKNGVYNLNSSKEALNSLKTYPKRGDSEDFNNLLSGAKSEGREKFANFLFNKYAKGKIKAVKDNKIRLKSRKEINGMKINNKTYIITIKNQRGKEYLQARSFKTGRVVKFNKRWLKKLSL